MKPAMYIGWSNALPAGHAWFLLRAAVLILVSAIGLGTLLAATTPDPGAGRFAEGEITLTGTVTPLPYPMLHLPDGRSLLLSGEGKQGPAIPAAVGRGAMTATGYLIHRGSLEMLQIPAEPSPEPAGAGTEPKIEELGRWRITGEICDGKCTAGAMRPGTGLSHKACANFCLAGDVPPVFVAVQPVAGSQFMLLGNADGGRLPPSALHLTALRISVEGRLQRLGGMLVFLADFSTAKLP